MHTNFTRRIYLSILISFLFFSFTFGQTITITGTVYDEYKDPMIGLNVILKENPAIGASTDIDGKYTIEVPAKNSTLVFQYLGYAEKEVIVGTETTIDVYMKTDAAQLAEVQVTALGIKRQKREIGYSTESFGGVEIEKSNAPNVVSALSGRAAGVQIASPNGVDGGTTRITIRGNNNIGANNQPLVVVDGVPLENQAGLENIGRGVDWGSAINNINPADIESMNILKGPTASALYGSRGANGVILITTKRGKKQKGIGIQYSVQHKVIQPYRYREVQNVYGAGAPASLLEPTLTTNAEGNPNHLSTNAFYPDNGPNGEPSTSTFGFYGTGVSWGPRMEGQLIEWWDGEIRPYSPQPDNLKLYFQNGNTTTHNLSFSGGNDMGTMRVSLTRTDHNAIVPNSNYNQTTVNIGSRLDISTKLKADISVNYINYYRLNSPTLGDDHQNSFSKGVLYSFPRSYKGLEKDLNINSDGTRNDFDGRFPFLYSGQDIWWNTYNDNTELNRNKLLGALSLTYDVNSWLNVTGRLGLDFTLNEFERRSKPYNNLGIEGGIYSNELNRDRVNNNEFLINLHRDKIFDSDFDLSFSVGGSQWSRSQYGQRGESNKWINPWLFTFDNVDRSFAYTNQDPTDTLTIVLAPDESFQVTAPDDFLTASEVRFDKKINSVFSFQYFYPSASLSFIATEAFDIKRKGLSFLKLRGAYAQTASDSDPFLIDRVYDVGNFGGLQTASSQGTIPPIELRPQRATSYEIGATLGFFDDKINLDFTYYYINSFDQILDAPLPSSSGATKVRINTGELENKGFEAILNIKLMQRRNFFWETSFNIGRNRNKVVSLGDSGAEILELADIWGLNGPAIAVREGEEFGTIIGYDYIYHENGQPIINEAGTHYEFTENRVPVGNASPDFTGGWSMRLGYKGLSLSTLVDTKWGGDIYAGSYVIGLQTGQSPETLLEREGGGLPFTDPEGNVRNVGVVLPGVQADGTANEEVVHYFYKYIPNTGGWGRWLTTPGVLENSWVKLREVSLTYQFPETLTARTNVFQDLSISLVARDLFYLYTSLPDQINPEGSNGSGNAQGLEWASFPGVRSFGFSLNAGF